jgi:superfamily II DNA or RNA helicase
MAGVEVGVIGDGVWQPKKVTVAMVQTLATKLKDPDPFSHPADQKRQLAIQAKVRTLLSKYEVVILEEAHEASGDSYYGIMSYCVNAHYRLALTATPFMKDDAEDNMRLMACVGPIGIKVTEEQLINKGILAKPFFKYIDNPPPAKVKRTTSWQRAYKLGIVECAERNKLVVSEAAKMKKIGLTGIILVQHTRHGDILKKIINANGLKALFIRGESTREERQLALDKLGRGDIDVLIGTSILDVGVDVPSVGYVILAGGGKAEVNLRQRIGRCLRRKKAGPNISFVIDFADKHNTHTRDHGLQRRYIVENTKGFGENIIPAGKEFDLSDFK